MDTWLQAGGIYHIALILFHLRFRRIFGWDQDLRSLTRLNRAIMPVLNLSLTWVFAIFAYLSLVHTDELLNTPLGHSLLLMISLLWLFRSIMQIVYFSLQHWVSWAFLGWFLLGVLLYGIPAATTLA